MCNYLQNILVNVSVPNNINYQKYLMRGRLKICLFSFSTDPDHKPDLVWPMSHNIVASAITPCSSLVALGLSGGLVVVWDKHLGKAPPSGVS